MNRIIEIVAMAVGGLSLFLVCFVGFASLSGKDVSQVPVIGKLFPEPPDDEGHGDELHVLGEEGHDAGEELSDSAVIEASLGVLSAWTLPSPYSTSELRVLSEEIKRRRGELEERELSLARRERAVELEENELEERVAMLEELRTHLESLQKELTDREVSLTRIEDSTRTSKDSVWSEVAGVIGTIEDPAAAAKRLQEYSPAEAAKILRSLEDDVRAGEILNQVPGARWKEFVDAYTSEKARASRR